MSSSTRSFTPPRQRKVYVPRETRLASATSTTSLASITSVSSTGSSSSSESRRSPGETSTLSTSTNTSLEDHQLARGQGKSQVPQLMIDTGVMRDDGMRRLAMSPKPNSRRSLEEGDEVGSAVSEVERLSPSGSRFVENLDHDVSSIEIQAFLYGTIASPSSIYALRSVSPHRLLIPGQRERRKVSISRDAPKPFQPGSSPLSSAPLSSRHPAEQSEDSCEFLSIKTSPISPISPIPIRLTAAVSRDEASQDTVEALVSAQVMSTSPSRPGAVRSNTTPEDLPTLRTMKEMKGITESRRQSMIASSFDRSPDGASEVLSSPSKGKRPLSRIFRRPSTSGSDGRSSLAVVRVDDLPSGNSSTSLAVKSPKARQSRHGPPEVKQRVSSMYQDHPDPTLQEQARLSGDVIRKPSIVVSHIPSTVKEERIQGRRGSTGWKRLWEVVSGGNGGTIREPSPPRLRKMSKMSDLNLAAGLADERPQTGSLDARELSRWLPGVPKAEQDLSILREAPTAARSYDVLEVPSGIVSRTGTILSARSVQSSNRQIDGFHAYSFPSNALTAKLANLATPSPQVTDDQVRLGRRRTMMSARLGQAPRSSHDAGTAVTPRLKRRHTAQMPVRLAE